MSLLDLQALEAQSATKGGHGGGHGGEGGSEVSLLLCDSTASVLLCL